jgi:hypothetical protein
MGCGAAPASHLSAIVCWRLDSLGRTAKGLTALFHELYERKVNLVSLKDGIDLNTPAGRLMANMLASVAQYETEVRAERVMAGQARARSQGKRWGGSVRGRRLKVTDEQLAVIKRMQREVNPFQPFQEPPVSHARPYTITLLVAEDDSLRRADRLYPERIDRCPKAGGISESLENVANSAIVRGVGSSPSSCVSSPVS